MEAVYGWCAGGLLMLSVVLATGCAVSLGGSDRASEADVFQNRGLYLWGSDPQLLLDLVENGRKTDRFFDRADAWDVGTVYWNWRATEHFRTEDLSRFIQRAHEEGIRVEALVGSQGLDGIERSEQFLRTLDEAIRAMEGSPWFDGIHLNLEPGDDRVDAFLTEFRFQIDRVTDSPRYPGFRAENLPVSVSVGWWWARRSRAWNSFLWWSEVNYFVVMSYRDNLEQVVRSTEEAMRWSGKPYAVALDMGQLEEGNRGSMQRSARLVEDVFDSPRREVYSRFRGTVIHHYESAVE